MKKITKISLSIFAGLGLLKIFSIIPFNRMAADDYSSAIMGRLGLLGSIIATYKGFMGRFTAVLIETPFSVNLAENGKIAIYSIITFSLLFLSILLLVKRIFNLSSKNIYLYIVSSVLFVSLYQLTPDKSESWYWLTGSVVYLWPIILFTFSYSFVFLKSYRKVDYILPVILVFFSVSCNEAFGLFVPTLLFISLWFFRKNKLKRKLLGIMFIFSLVSFLIMYLAPGNDARKMAYGSFPMSILGSILYSLWEGPKRYLQLIMQNAYFIIPTMILMSFSYADFNLKIKKLNTQTDELIFNFFEIVILGFILSIIFMLPSFVGLGRVQPERSVLSLSFIVVAQMLMGSYYFYEIVFKKIGTKNMVGKLLIFSAGLALLISSSVFTKTLASDLYIAKNYAVSFDTMIKNFKSISRFQDTTTEIEISLPESGMVARLIDPVGVYSYKNLSLSQYYNIGKVITVEHEK